MDPNCLKTAARPTTLQALVPADMGLLKAEDLRTEAAARSLGQERVLPQSH